MPGKYLITDRHSPHSLTRGAEEFFFGMQFIPQVGGVLHGGTGLFVHEVRPIIELLRKIPVPPVRF